LNAVAGAVDKVRYVLLPADHLKCNQLNPFILALREDVKVSKKIETCILDAKSRIYVGARDGLKDKFHIFAMIDKGNAVITPFRFEFDIFSFSGVKARRIIRILKSFNASFSRAKGTMTDKLRFCIRAWPPVIGSKRYHPNPGVPLPKGITDTGESGENGDNSEVITNSSRHINYVFQFSFSSLI